MTKPFSGVPTSFYPVTLTLKFDILFENFNLSNNFGTVSALILHMSILCVKTFPQVPTFLPSVLELEV